MRKRTTKRIRIDQIDVPACVRRPLDAQAQSRLMRSLSVTGPLETIQVNPLPNGRFELVHGYRRFQAEMAREQSRITATITPASPIESLLVLLTSEETREPRTLLERAWLMEELRQRLANAGLPHQQKDLCHLAGAAKATVSEHLELADLFPKRKVETKVAARGADLSTVRGASRKLLREARKIEDEGLRVGELISRTAKNPARASVAPHPGGVQHTPRRPGPDPIATAKNGSPGEPSRVRLANWRGWLRAQFTHLLRRLTRMGAALKRRIRAASEVV